MSLFVLRSDFIKLVNLIGKIDFTKKKIKIKRAARSRFNETKLTVELFAQNISSAIKNGHIKNLLRRCWICWGTDVRGHGTQMSRHQNHCRRFERGTHPTMEFRQFAHL